MKKLQFSIFALLVASNFVAADSNYKIKNHVIDVNKKICGELLEIPDGVVLHKVSQRTTNTPYGISGDKECTIQFVTLKETNLSNAFFEIILYDSYDNSISSVERHQVK